jgi:GNAT superfamily N-acetyltransferase
MKILTLHAEEPAWDTVAAYAAGCPWRAGAYLAELMRSNRFAEWERVIAAFEGECPIGFCTLTAKDEMPESCDFTPFIGFVYVDAAYRGRRISEQMIAAASDYAKSLGYPAVYLTSDEQGLYEKYGFTLLGAFENVQHELTQLFRKPLKQ